MGKALLVDEGSADEHGRSSVRGKLLEEWIRDKAGVVAGLVRRQQRTDANAG